MDSCEGCEYAVLDELRAKPALRKRIQSMAGELHGCGNKKDAAGLRCFDAQVFIIKHWPAPPTRPSAGRNHGFTLV